jgi:hypothetical protein
MRSVLTTSAAFALLGFLGFISMLFSIFALVGSLIVGSSPGSLLEACCGLVLARLSVGWLLFAAVGIAAIFVLARLTRSLWRLRGAAQRVRGLKRVSEEVLVEGHTCRVFEHDRPLAFCAGLIQPAIYLSRTAVNDLPPATLRVVVIHEEQHRLNRDPLRKAITRTLAQSFFFFPALGPVGQKYLALAEIRADRAAAAAARAGQSDVADALLAFPAGESDSSMSENSSDRIDDLSANVDSWAPARSTVFTTLVALTALLSAPVVAVELTTSVPVGFEALGLHVCLLILTLTPMVLAALAFLSRPSFQLR